MIDEDRRAELIEQKYKFLREQEEREQAAAQQPDPLAEALAMPIETVNSRHRREIAERDEAWAEARAARVRQQEEIIGRSRTAPPDWDERICAAMAVEREHLDELLAELVAEIEDRVFKHVDNEMRPRDVQIAELKLANVELKLANAQLRTELINNASGSRGMAGISSGVLN
jgi:hypothetical protein